MSGTYTIRPAAIADLSAVETALRDSEHPLDGLRDQFGDGYAVAEANGHQLCSRGSLPWLDDSASLTGFTPDGPDSRI